MKQTISSLYRLILLCLCAWCAGQVYGAKNFIIEKPTETIGVCDTELPYSWHSKLYYQKGTYRDTVILPGKETVIDEETTVKDRDTSVIYTMEFFTMPIRTVHAEIIEGHTLMYRGKKYKEAGMFYDTVPGVECDSLIRLYISYADYFHMFDTAHMCEGAPYKNWRGRELRIPGNYYDSLTTASGRDSIYQMTLVVHYPAESWDTLQLCPDQKYYYWNGKRYNKSGDYTMEFKTPYGCDSVCHLNLTFLTEPEPVVQTEYFCANIGVVLNGRTFYEKTTVIDTLPSRSGCDSIVETHYIPRPSQLYEQIIQHYKGDPVTWRGNTYTEDGVYYDSLINVFGCDSVYQLRVVPKSDTYVTVNRCEGDQVVLEDGQVISSNTIILDTLRNRLGGDSVIHTTYNFTESYHFNERITICSNQYVEWVGHNQELHAPGIYRDAYRTASGCDSVYEIEVTVKPAYLIDTTVIWCNDSLMEKGPFVWTDSKGVRHEWNKLNTDTTIIDTMSHTMPEYLQYTDGSTGWEFNTGGCDSISRLRIIVTDRCSSLERIPMCEGGSVTVDGEVYTEPGRYFHRMPSSRNLNVQDSTHSFEIYIVYPSEETINMTICESQLPFLYNERRLTQGGNYDFPLTNRYGCDSIIHLHLTVTPTKYSPVNEEHFCPSETFHFQLGSGRVVTKPGDYFDTVPWKGCDSIVRYRLLWAPTHNYSDTAYFKQGTTYAWHKNGAERILDKEGIYWDSCTNVYGCDSVYRLYLREARPFFKEESPAKLCTHELPWLWHGKEISEEGTYWDSCHTYFGLDSVYKIVVSIYPSYKIEKQVNICADQDYYVNGNLVTGSIYRDEQKTINGCDSVTIYYINREPVSRKDETAYFAENTVYTWPEHNKSYSHGGHYYDTVRSTLGCDSIIYNLYLIEQFKAHYITDSVVCLPQNGHVLWHGKTIHESGTYYDSLSTWFGLDSVWQLNLTIHRDTVVQWHADLCRDGFYDFFGQILTEPGTYTSPVFPRTETGCDSIIELILQPFDQEETVIRYPLCEGDELRFGDSVYTSNAVHVDTLKSVMGCDSIVRRIISMGKKYFFRSEVTVNPGDPYTWHRNGQPRILTAPGSYWDSCTTVLGCDSVYFLYLKEAEPFYEEETPVWLCENELPWTWHGKQIKEPGIHWDSLKTRFGLDSVYKLEVLMYPSYKIEKQVNICANQDYYVNGNLVTGSVYRDTLQSVKGCDSITVYYINRSTLSIQDETAHFAANTVYTWQKHNMTFDHGGHYYDTVRSTLGCDSIIYHLFLVEEHAYHFTNDSAVCLPQNGHVLWHGQTLTTSGTYYDRLTTKFGLDSVYRLNLTVSHDTLVQWQASLCAGASYNFFGHELTEPGTYTSAAFPRTGTGCDSIIELILQPVSTEETVLTYTMCEGDTYTIGDTTFTTSGIYLDTLKSIATGCDSVVRHIITVGKKYFFSSEILINPGTSYTFHKDGSPLLVDQPGTYWDSCTTILGCDSIYKLTVRFNQTEYIFPTVYDRICASDLPYVWHHKSITASGLYYDSLKTNHGRDSVYSLYLTVYETVRNREELDFCQGEYPVINGMPYSRDAVFTDTLTTHTGCDSIVDYVLHFHSAYSMNIVANITDGEEYVFGDTIIRTTGVYFRRFTTIYGCDSLVTLTVKACPTTKQQTVYHDICQGEPLTINGKAVETSGTFYETYKSADGCDSLVYHIVNIHNSYFYSTSATICKGSAYKWTGHKGDIELTKQGVYFDSLTTAYGCDSIYRLILNYRHSDTKDTIITLCESELPYSYRGKYYFKDSVFTDTLGSNMQGCDSLLLWHYRINRHCSDYVQYNRCTGQIINIDGLLISQEGAYEQHHLTADGQDSLYRFTVRDVQHYEFTTRKSGCDSVVYNGKTYYARGLGGETFTVDLNHRTVDGCDSLEHLELTIYTSSPTHVYSKTIADYDSVRFGPYYHNTTGQYTITYTNSHNCDSTEVLDLTVLKTEYQPTVRYYICRGDARGVEVFGKRVHPVQEYTYISDTTWIAGLPVIRSAEIIMQQPFAIASFDPDENQVVCSEHEVMFYVSYTAADHTVLPDYYEVDFLIGDLEAHPLHQEGAVDGKTVLPILMDGQGKYVAPGYYRYRLKLRSESCVVSDTILEGSVLVRYPSSVMEAAWNDAVMLLNENYNGGGWVFQAPYKWQVLSNQGVDKTALVAGDVTNPYIYSSALEEGDRISATLIREGYTQAIPTCEYIFQPVLPVLTNPILVYPSAVQARTHVTVKADRPGEFFLMDQTGRIYTRGRFGEGESQVLIPGVSGCYLMVLQDENGQRAVQRLIVY